MTSRLPECKWFAKLKKRLKPMKRHEVRSQSDVLVDCRCGGSRSKKQEDEKRKTETYETEYGVRRWEETRYWSGNRPTNLLVNEKLNTGRLWHS